MRCDTTYRKYFLLHFSFINTHFISRYINTVTAKRLLHLYDFDYSRLFLIGLAEKELQEIDNMLSQLDSFNEEFFTESSPRKGTLHPQKYFKLNEKEISKKKCM